MSRPYLSVKDTLFAIRYSPVLFQRSLRSKRRTSNSPSVFNGARREKQAGPPEHPLRLAVPFPSTGGMDVSLHTLDPAFAGYRRRAMGIPLGHGGRKH